MSDCFHVFSCVKLAPPPPVLFSLCNKREHNPPSHDATTGERQRQLVGAQPRASVCGDTRKKKKRDHTSSPASLPQQSHTDDMLGGVPSVMAAMQRS